jgi:formate-dependent nitrite reductase membrane component NrfD
VWLLLWLVVIVGLAAPFALSRLDAARRWAPVTAPILALLGVLALRALVIFSAQS